MYSIKCKIVAQNLSFMFFVNVIEILYVIISINILLILYNL